MWIYFLTRVRSPGQLFPLPHSVYFSPHKKIFYSVSPPLGTDRNAERKYFKEDSPRFIVCTSTLICK